MGVVAPHYSRGLFRYSPRREVFIPNWDKGAEAKIAKTPAFQAFIARISIRLWIILLSEENANTDDGSEAPKESNDADESR